MVDGDQQNEKIPFSQRRIFVHNMSYEVTFQDLKDYFTNEAGCGSGFVEMLPNPKTGKPSGGAIVEFRTPEEVEKAVACDTNELKGRKLFINKEPDTFHLRRFCDKFGFDFKMNNRGKPDLFVKGARGGDQSRGGNTDIREHDRRVFVHNLSFDVQFGDLKDFFKEEGEIAGGGFVEMMKRPDNSKSVGAAVVDFKTSEDCEKALALDKRELKGRKCFIQKDPSLHHLKRFCDKFGYEIRMDPKNNPFLILKGSGGPPAGAPQMGMPPAPSGQQFHTPDGKPIIQNLGDLLASTVFYSNLPWTCNESDIKDLFESCGRIRNCKLLTENDDHQDENKRGKSRGMGLVEYERARDAQRAVIMLNDSSLSGRQIRVRASNDLRELPNNLTELGRPMPETNCIDQCRQAGVDPFSNCTVFVANLRFESSQSDLLDVFNLVGDVYESRLLMKDGKSRGMAVIKLTSGYDAQQCINVLNDSSLHGRQINVRFDKDAMQSGQGMPPQQMQYNAPPAQQQMQYGGPAQPPMYGGQSQQQQHQPPPPRFDQRAAPAPTTNPDQQVNQLASLLGIDANTLNALRLMQNQNKAAGVVSTPAQPPAQHYTPPSKQHSGRERSPHRQPKQESTYRNGNSTDSYMRNGNDTANQNAPVSANVKTENKNWNPVTNDTIYIRNLPSCMSEAQLRYMFGQAGPISFMDFPLKHDSTPVGYSYIRYDGDHSAEACKRAVDQFNAQSANGCKLEVGLY